MSQLIDAWNHNIDTILRRATLIVYIFQWQLWYFIFYWAGWSKGWTSRIPPSVTGLYVHAPININSPYRQTIICSIYNTRQPRHPQSPIRRYKLYPHVPRLHGLVTWNPVQYNSIYVYLYRYFYSLAKYHDPREQQTLRRYINSPSIAAYYTPPRSPS